MDPLFFLPGVPLKAFARVTVFPLPASSRTIPDYRPEGGTLV